MGNNLGKKAMKNNKNNETQSRREFFKEAAKKALPIVSAIALIGNPVIAKAVENESLGCYGCSGTCQGTCSGSCQWDACKFSCTGTCKGGCSSCSGSCKGSNYF